MGMRGPFSSSSVDYSVPNPNNPDPMNFELMEWQTVGEHLVVKLRYPNCTNFKGVKLLLFTNTTIDELRSRNEIDPHFCFNYKSPFARFVPTKVGWETAIKVANIL